MKIPTPSFFKIRLVALVIAFLVMCFVVGVVRDVWAVESYPGECIMVKSSNAEPLSGMSSRSMYNFNVDIVNGTISLLNVGQRTSGKAASTYIFWRESTGRWRLKAYIENKWVPTDYNLPGIYIDGGTYASQYIPSSGTPCPEDCLNAELDLIRECGGQELIAWEWTDEATCTGRCIPCRNAPDGQESRLEAITRCSESDQNLAYFDEEECIGVCDSCTIEQYVTEKEKCGQLLYTYNQVTCEADCQEECTPEYGRFAAESYCSAEGKIPSAYTCVGTPSSGYHLVPGSITCIPGGLTVVPNESDPGEEKPDPAEPPPSTDPSPDPTDPNDENQWNDAQKENLDKIIGQNDKILQDNADQEKLLGWIGENARVTANNTNAIARALQDGSNKTSLDSESKGLLNGVQDGLGDIEGALDGIAEGSYSGPGTNDPYAVEEHDFGVRTTQFLNEMKSTALFSIPNTLKDSIPGGGSSVLTISSGETFGGDHTIDFSSMSSGLNILKYLIQIAGMALAIRIVTLKR